MKRLTNDSQENKKMKTKEVKFKDLKIGDLVVEHPSVPNELYGFVFDLRSKASVGILIPASPKEYSTREIRENGDTLIRIINLEDGSDFDINKIKEELNEIVSTKRVLPYSDRINEPVFNLFEEGALPTLEEMRLLLLRYHKALTQAENKIALYDKLIYPEKEEVVEARQENYNPPYSREKLKSAGGLSDFMKNVDEYIYTDPELKPTSPKLSISKHTPKYTPKTTTFIEEVEDKLDSGDIF